MSERCRLCFRPFVSEGGTIAISSSDPSICYRCWWSATDQSDAKEMSPSQKIAEGLRLSGLSPDAPTEVTPQGGKHSAIGMAFHHLDSKLMLALAQILYTGGVKYGRHNQYNISVEDHINHALAHVFGELSGDKQDQHLAHAILRLMFAWTVKNEGGTYFAAS